MYCFHHSATFNSAHLFSQERQDTFQLKKVGVFANSLISFSTYLPNLEWYQS